MRLTVAISWFFEWTPAGLVVDAEARRDEKNARAAGKKLDYAIITIFAVAVVYFAIDKFVVSPQREAELIASATEAGAAQALEDQRQKAAAIPHESVAVLPFINQLKRWIKRDNRDVRYHIVPQITIAEKT